MSKPLNAASAVSLSEKDINLGVTWADPAWIPHLSAANVMDYFAHPSNPFYDPKCNNEIIRMQRLSLDQLKNMTGTEFVLAHIQDPILYVVKRQIRISPQEVHPQAVYYILAGTVYQAPDLWSVINSRLLNTSHFLHSAATELNSYVRYHPSNGYYWDIKNPANGSKVTFVPTDPTRKVTEETGTAFQRKNVDGLLASLVQKFPFKPAPSTQHPYGPKSVPKENGVNQQLNGGPQGTNGSVEAIPDIDVKPSTGV